MDENAEGLEPLIDSEERARILEFVREQVNNTIDEAASGERLDATDAVEAFLDLGILVGSMLAPPGLRTAITVLAPVVRPLVMTPIENAVAAAQTSERLLVRADAAEDAAEDHIDSATALTETPEREFFEKLRVNIHLRRASYLRRRAMRLRARAARP